MKKPQINLDLTNVKRFLGAHVEKIGIAAAAGLFLWFGLKAVQRETFEQQPEELDALVNQARQNVDKTIWDPETHGKDIGEIANYADQADNSRKPIERVVDNLAPFNPPTFGAKAKRGEPQFLAAHSLEVSAGFGAFATDSDTKGYRFVIAKGLVPWDEQVKLHDAALREADGWDFENDQPRYLGCQLQRFVKDAAGEWKPDGRATPFRYESALDRQQQERWADFAPPLVSMDLIADEDLVYPLGPLADAPVGQGSDAFEDPLGRRF